jgi:hypothetical protein
MSYLPVSHLPGEAILLQDDNAVYIKNNLLGFGYQTLTGTLWLTTQRIMFRAAVPGTLTVYPLSHIARVLPVEVRIANKTGRNSSRPFTAALYLGFDDGGREYLIPQDIPAWAAAILAAKTGAPALPFSQTPPARSAVEERQRSLWALLGVFVATMLCGLCGGLLWLGVSFLLAVVGVQ